MTMIKLNGVDCGQGCICNWVDVETWGDVVENLNPGLLNYMQFSGVVPREPVYFQTFIGLLNATAILANPFISISADTPLRNLFSSSQNETDQELSEMEFKMIICSEPII